MATIAKVRKEAKYSHLSQSFTLTPIAIESLGVLGLKSAAFLHELGHKISLFWEGEGQVLSSSEVVSGNSERYVTLLWSWTLCHFSHLISVV